MVGIPQGYTQTRARATIAQANYQRRYLLCFLFFLLTQILSLTILVFGYDDEISKDNMLHYILLLLKVSNVLSMICLYM